MPFNNKVFSSCLKNRLEYTSISYIIKQSFKSIQATNLNQYRQLIKQCASKCSAWHVVVSQKSTVHIVSM